MRHLDRRHFLTAMLAATVSSVAGCLGDDDDDTDTDGTIPEGDISRYSEWASNAVVDDGSVLLGHYDVQAMRDRWPEAYLDDVEFDDMAAEFDVDADDIDGFLMLISGFRFTTALFGSFDRDAVLEAYDPFDDPETVGEYYVVDDFVAIGDDAIITSSMVREILDAGIDGTARVIDEREHWERAVRAIETPEMSMYMELPGEAFDLIAMSLTYADDLFDLTAYLFYPDADTAEADMDDIEDEMEDDFVEGEITEITRIGNVIVLRAQTDFDLIEDEF